MRDERHRRLHCRRRLCSTRKLLWLWNGFIEAKVENVCSRTQRDMNSQVGTALRFILPEPLPNVGSRISNDGIVAGVVTDLPTEHLVPDTPFLQRLIVVGEGSIQQVAEEFRAAFAGLETWMGKDLRGRSPDRLLFCLGENRPISNH